MGLWFRISKKDYNRYLAEEKTQKHEERNDRNLEFVRKAIEDLFEPKDQVVHEEYYID